MLLAGADASLKSGTESYRLESKRNRIARPGQGKSRGYRTIILFRRGSKAFFVYGFPKSHRTNINDDEEKQFKEAAKHVPGLTEKQLGQLLERCDFVEVMVK